jgi:outer membrane lipoprotein LolB
MNNLRYLFIFSVCFLSACATYKMTPDQQLQPEKTTGINELKNDSSTQSAEKSSATHVSSWNLSGAMAARNSRKGWSAALNWEQQGLNQYQIRLMGPLGGGTVVITKNGGMVTYTDGPKKISSRNADELLMKQTGTRLPVNSLYYWVRGLPAPGQVQSSHIDKNHNLTSLTQAGYTINYSNYILVNNVSLPGKIQLQGRGVLIKLVIKHWSI